MTIKYDKILGKIRDSDVFSAYTTENISNKSTNISLGTSDILYPSQNAVKTYIDTQLGDIQTALTAILGV